VRTVTQRRKGKVYLENQDNKLLYRKFLKTISHCTKRTDFQSEHLSSCETVLYSHSPHYGGRLEHYFHNPLRERPPQSTSLAVQAKVFRRTCIHFLSSISTECIPCVVILHRLNCTQVETELRSMAPFFSKLSIGIN
jgi:hypothetical protein